MCTLGIHVSLQKLVNRSKLQEEESYSGSRKVVLANVSYNSGVGHGPA